MRHSFYFICLKWFEYSISTMQKKEDLLMSNSCLNTQCFFFCICKKKSIIFHTCGIFILFSFSWFFFIFEKEKKTAKKEIDERRDYLLPILENDKPLF